jgi:hypothetical protein
MAIVHVVTASEVRAARRACFRVACKGVSQKEFASLYRILRDELECKVAIRNPSPVLFDAKAVHELIVHVTGTAIGGYALKQGIDAVKELFVAYIKFKFLTPSDSGTRRQVTIYDATGKLYEFKDGKKSKRGQ